MHKNAIATISKKIIVNFLWTIKNRVDLIINVCYNNARAMRGTTNKTHIYSCETVLGA